MPKDIKIEFKDCFGKKLMFPKCKTAKLLCKIANKATISDLMFIKIRKLGYTISVFADQPQVKDITWKK